MKLAFSRVLASFLFTVCLAPMARAAAVEVDLTGLYAIQTYDLAKGDDQAYLLVNGVANGKEFAGQMPKDKTWTAAPKKIIGSIKAPELVWKGDLADGEFALITVTLMQGKAADAAKIKAYLDKKMEAEKAVAERAKPKLAQADFDKLHTDTIKAQQALLKDIKKLLSREQNTDHFGGLFDILIWNNGGKIVKRLDTPGLSFGEHYGVDPKIYTKIKNSRPNVLMQDVATGEWGEQQLTPLNDEQDAIRVKMLETELVKGAGDPTKNTTDYVAEIQVKAGGKALKWELGGDHPGPTDLHIYWDFAQ